MNYPETIIELRVRSRRFGDFHKAMHVEDATEELERECLKGSVETLVKALEKWCRPKWPDPITAAVAKMVMPCPHCGGYPTLIHFQADGSVCLACMNPDCKEQLHTDAFKNIEDDRVMLAMWNHLCMVAREKLDKEEEAKA